MGQLTSVLHDLVSSWLVAKAHAAPPYCDAVDTANCLLVVPAEPHVAVQSLHPLQAPTQSMGHKTSVLQDVLSVVLAATGHSTPPATAICETSYLRSALPPGPHDSLHAPHALHAPMQSTGQSAVLHDCCTV
jgi:hypothetical protein